MTEKKPERISFDDVDFSKPDVLKNPPYRYRRCPVLVTLVDAQISVVDVQKMLQAGMNIARFQLSNSTRGDKMRLLAKIDKAARFCCEKNDVNNWPVASCFTLKTCVAKTGLLEDNEDFITLVANTEIILFYDVKRFDKCNERKIFVDYPLIAVDIKVDTVISIAFDEIILKCISIVDEISIKCIVIKGGMLTSLCVLNARNTKRSGPLVTKKDLEMVQLALDYQVDAVLINYTRHSDTVKIIKKFIKSKNVRNPLILSGISCEEGLQNIDDIIKVKFPVVAWTGEATYGAPIRARPEAAHFMYSETKNESINNTKESDGIILSRQYLPYEMESCKQYKMPQIQKWLAGKCLSAGKPLFISGGVFNEALKSGNFNNNEIADVTNALMDGVSGFILGGCYNPDNIIEALRGINELCFTIEPLVTSKICFKRIIEEVKMPVNAAEATAMSCVAVANQTNARVIIVPTVTGKTLRYLLWMRPSCLIITVSTDIHITRYLISYRSVMPLLYTGSQKGSWRLNMEARILFALEYAVKRNWLEYGDTYISLQRYSDSSSFCDSVSICKVSISKKSLVECEENLKENYLF